MRKFEIFLLRKANENKPMHTFFGNSVKGKGGVTAPKVMHHKGGDSKFDPSTKTILVEGKKTVMP